MKGTTRPGCTAMSGNGLAAGTYYPDPDAAPSDGLGYTTPATNSPFDGGGRDAIVYAIYAHSTAAGDQLTLESHDGTKTYFSALSAVSIRQGPALSFPGGLRIPGGFRVNAGGTGSWDFVIAYEVDGTL